MTTIAYRTPLSPRRLASIHSKKTLFDDLDTDDAEAFQRITSNYLKKKYSQVTQESEQASMETQIKSLMTKILPPLSSQELSDEIKRLSPIISASKLDENSFINALVNNAYWMQAGPMVVQELIYLDSLHSYYHQKVKILNDEDYEDLKSQLTWSGSDVTSMTGKEALFVFAVASHRRGDSLLNDQQYETLKQQLLAENSWVVKRGADGLEKLGIDTYLGYLHRSF